MTLTNKLKPIVDVPVFEWGRFAPVVNSALSAWTTQDDGKNRFIYYLIGSAFYRYDTYADAWQQLATPNVAPVTILSMRFAPKLGFNTRVLGATATSITIAGLRGKIMDGKTIIIRTGTGQGQERVLTFQNETIHDFGVITGTTTSTLVDSTKKWKINQWAGYTVGITFGTDVTQYKKILYNDATTLYIADSNLQTHESKNNQIFVANAPYALPATTAGSQAHYQITSQTFAVAAWTVQPDYTSYAEVMGGGIFMVSAAAAAPFFTFQYYDVLHDSWQTKTTPQSLLPSALATDASLEKLIRLETPFVTGTATAGSSTTLTDSGLSLAVDRYENYRIRIISGTGVGQNRRIVCNTATVFTVEQAWDINPDATSVYEVHADYDKVFLAGMAMAAMFGYSVSKDMWMQGEDFDAGITNNIAATMKGRYPIGISTGVRQTTGITGVNATPTAAGSGYKIGDVLTCSASGSGGKVIVESITPTGGVASISLIACGTGYSTGVGKSTTGGTGSACTIEITSVGTNCLVTTATAHWFKTGDQVTISGCNSAGYNTLVTIFVDSTTTFTFVTSEASNMAASNSQSATVIVDPTKNWTPNEHVGRLVHVIVAGTSPTSQIRRITANTATTLTVASITSAVNGTSRYIIYDCKAFGRDDQYKQADKMNFGHASGGSLTTLVDSSKNWIPNQWAGYVFRINAGTGYGSQWISIISNTETTLTYTTQAFTPDASTHYEIADTFGLATAGSTTTITETTTKNWITNQFAGKRVRIMAGLGVGQEATISSNTATALTTGSITAPDATSVYCILGIPVRGAGIELCWIWNETDSAKKGRRILFPRGGGSNTWDIYDIPTEKWQYGLAFSPQQELMNVGSMFAYDGVDTIYAQLNALGKIMAYNLLTDAVQMVGNVPYGMSTAVAGNRMEIVQTADGLKYLYLMRHSAAEIWRMLLFF